MHWLACVLLLLPTFAFAGTFEVVLQRETTEGGLVVGTMTVNGELLGTFMENDDLKITAGTYRGLLRYASSKGFAQGEFGALANEGDFLLEVSGVEGRSNILFHTGNKPHHSKGCIMLGGVTRDDNGVGVLSDDHPLRKLRLAFYGADVPNSSPAVNIVVRVVDAPSVAVGCDWTSAAPCVSEVLQQKGTRCGKPRSSEVTYRNDCGVPVKIVGCTHTPKGWRCGPDGTFDTGLQPGDSRNFYACDGDQHHLYAMPIDAFVQGRCRYPRTVGEGKSD